MRHGDVESDPMMYLFGFVEDCHCGICEEIEAVFVMVNLETAKTMED